MEAPVTNPRNSPAQKKLPFIQQMERSLAALSVRNNFWHRFFSFFFLPAAWRSGIQMKWKEEALVPRLPYKRGNRNWYGAMSGATLAGNAEIAGGLILNRQIGRDFTCVCKKLTYRFLRPCLGAVEYRMISLTGLEEGMASQREFNVDINMHIYQICATGDKVVGKSEVTFHLVPKSLVECSIFHPFGKRKQKSIPRPKAGL